MGQDPPGVLQGAFWSGMPGMAQGSQRHEPRHLTSALQLSLALTLSRLETHMGLEQGLVDVSAQGFLLQDHNRLCLVSNKDTFPGSLRVHWEAAGH
ncbi:UDP-N-acetylmuramoylalanine--D-glutamate ligase, partial [Dissostichus eleginoides]